MVRVAIMQPYLFPYVGYFQLMKSVDVCVWLDDVQYVKNSWINRNRIIDANGLHWWTVPVVSAPHDTMIRDKEVELNSTHSRRLQQMLTHAYSGAPGWDFIRPVAFKASESGRRYLCQINLDSLAELASILNIKTEFRVSSAKAHDFSNSTDRLISIVKDLGASDYVNAPGGRNLYDPNDFLKAGLTLSYIRPFLQPYTQPGISFMPGLSIIDVLARCGLDDTVRQVSSNRAIIEYA